MKNLVKTKWNTVYEIKLTHFSPQENKEAPRQPVVLVRWVNVWSSGDWSQYTYRGATLAYSRAGPRVLDNLSLAVSKFCHKYLSKLDFELD